jgi:ferric-dicitrate binding protein FerR (iron transport regulator)
MTDEEEITARLLRLAGAREGAPADRASRVRSAVHQHWVSQTRRWRIQRRIMKGSALGVLVLITLLILRSRTTHETSNTVAAVASVEQVIGEGGFSRLSKADLIHPREWVDTGPARVALRLNDGTSVRIDRDTRVRLVSRSIAELARGGIYLDTGSTSDGVEVRTALGTVHDIGTQFEVRLTQAGLRIRVRTGLVEIRNDGRAASVRPGTEVTWTGASARTKAMPAFGSEWDWAQALAPRFDANGRSLAAFLEYTAREQGWTLRYGDPQLARDASGIILHGTLLELEPTDAVSVAVRMSGLAYSLEDGELVVTKPESQR